MQQCLKEGGIADAQHIETNVMERNFATFVIANEQKLQEFGGVERCAATAALSLPLLISLSLALSAGPNQSIAQPSCGHCLDAVVAGQVFVCARCCVWASGDVSSA